MSTARVPAPTPVRRGVVRLGPFSGRVPLRGVVVTAALVVTALGVAWCGLTSGAAGVDGAAALGALTGSADPAVTRVVVQWRLPRVVFCLLGGAALAMAGATFQSHTRNPLGSPDVIGFSMGAYTGALLFAVMGISGTWVTPLGAVVGGIGTGAAVYALAWRRGTSGSRIVVVGIGVSILLSSSNHYLLTTMRLEDAMAVATWGAGSVNDITWTHVWPVVAAMAVAVPVLVFRSREMALIEMGDDTARSLGVRTEQVRVVQLSAGIVLVAVVTAAAGPIAFVALAAPQLARRLVRGASVQLLPSAAMGALLLTASDLVARSPVMPAQLPVGVVTLCVGGTYLIWLLIDLRGAHRRGGARAGVRL